MKIQTFIVPRCRDAGSLAQIFNPFVPSRQKFFAAPPLFPYRGINNSMCRQNS